jgi:hypothetical protein
VSWTTLPLQILDDYISCAANSQMVLMMSFMYIINLAFNLYLFLAGKIGCKSQEAEIYLT